VRLAASVAPLILGEALPPAVGMEAKPPKSIKSVVGVASRTALIKPEL
jgi:hypothetical protein